jgi:hypothetical protein
MGTKEAAIISGFMGFAIGVCSMMFINIDKEVKQDEFYTMYFDDIKYTLIENINTCEDIVEWMHEDIWNEQADSSQYESYLYWLEDVINENRKILQTKYDY